MGAPASDTSGEGPPLDLTMNGKTIIVTGGASNIGRALSLAFALRGANVVIADLDLAQGEKVAKVSESSSGSCWPVKVDVTDWASVESMVGSVIARYRGIDVLVNNVGSVRRAKFVNKPREEWAAEIAVNYVSVLNCTRAVLDHMFEQRRGSIINIGSDAGKLGEYYESVYSGCKGAVHAFSKALAREVGAVGITVNVVSTGLVVPDNPIDDVGMLSTWAPDSEVAKLATPEMLAKIGAKYPLGRVGRPDDIVGAVLFLASDAARYITGQTISVSGGFSMV